MTKIVSKAELKSKRPDLDKFAKNATKLNRFLEELSKGSGY